MLSDVDVPPRGAVAVTLTSVLAAAAVVSLVLLAACGGGDGDGGSAAAPPPGAGSVTLAQRQSAAAGTAAGHALCTAVAPFYWSVGDAAGVAGEGSVGSPQVLAGTIMAIASASKLIYAAYVVQQRQGVPTADDIALLRFTSGYTQFVGCTRGQTVQQCQQANGVSNGGLTPAQVGRFFYSGGHMQRHAVLMGLGPDTAADLALHVQAGLGSTPPVIGFGVPQPAGGMRTSAQEYGKLLRDTVGARLALHALLGTSAVCTNPTTCASASKTPIPADESWQYSLGHWVENDPKVGDGAFSSPGAFGFYPWIDAGKRWWGVLAREDMSSTGGEPDRAGMASARCGREIRAAWLSGVAR
ncbi:MAG: hypothetical protein LH480_12290 [Rubrivivax sp.]|nr:hypothetical protein [Rubrivivax sp.]